MYGLVKMYATSAAATDGQSEKYVLHYSFKAFFSRKLAVLNLAVPVEYRQKAEDTAGMIGNAVKFTKSGIIKAECRAFSSKNKIEIRVSDTAGK